MGDTTVNGAIVDAYGNHIMISGDLDRVVTTGAAHGTPGTEARTGLSGLGMAIHDGTRWLRMPEVTEGR